MYIEYDDIKDPIEYIVTVVLKEAKKEDRIVRQIIYTLLSADTNNPQCLFINAPTGEGKSYDLLLVIELFPSCNIIVLAGMTEKALFHRSGTLVIKNSNGDYELIENKLEKIDLTIREKESELSSTADKNKLEGLTSLIQQLKKEKKDLLSQSLKLIDLSNKILVFLDTPDLKLLNTLMPLLSHDKYEVEYEYVDTYDGIKTKGNVLRGWPAVIICQALDISHIQRFPEFERRVITANPAMDKEKYKEAVQLTSIKFGLPHEVYGAKIVSDEEKAKAREVMIGIKDKIKKVCTNVPPGKNVGFIPYYKVIDKILPKENASDMTNAKRLMGLISLLSVVKSYKRPKLIVRKKASPILRIIPIAVFEDLTEAFYLLEHAEGVRPFILNWYKNVFLETYRNKTEPNSRTRKNGDLVSEKIIAVNTQELVVKTLEVMNQKYSSQKILETFLYPLLNHGFIDRIESQLDGRAYIYYPIKVEDTTLFENDDSNNLSHNCRIKLENSVPYPDEEFIMSNFQEIVKYYSENDYYVLIKSHDNNEISLEELVESYFGNSNEYFEVDGTRMQ